MLVLLGALLAVSGPHTLEPEEVCLMRAACDAEPVLCLVDDRRCPGPREPEICFVSECPEIRGPGSSR